MEKDQNKKVHRISRRQSSESSDRTEYTLWRSLFNLKLKDSSRLKRPSRSKEQKKGVSPKQLSTKFKKSSRMLLNSQFRWSLSLAMS
jgi:hypothetical protein